MQRSAFFNKIHAAISAKRDVRYLFWDKLNVPRVHTEKKYMTFIRFTILNSVAITCVFFYFGAKSLPQNWKHVKVIATAFAWSRVCQGRVWSPLSQNNIFGTISFILFFFTLDHGENCLMSYFCFFYVLVTIFYTPRSVLVDVQFFVNILLDQKFFYYKYIFQSIQ